MPDLLKTPLHAWHVAHGARMVEFGGWDMPVQYKGIVEEHHAVRRGVGLFDISHMGRLRFQGPQAADFLNHSLTCDVSRLKPGQVRYGLVCNDAGGILDDVLVYALPDCYWVVVNASNRLRIVDWLKTHQSAYDVEMADLTTSTGMLAIQGPHCSQALPGPRAALWQSLKYYGVLVEPLADEGQVLLSRTGYTGEDGCEIILPAEHLVSTCDHLMQHAAQSGVDLRPCGLGARDTLRLEAAMPLYGHELSESIDPLTAGLDFAVKLDKPDFVGKAALQAIAQRTDRPVRVGLELAGRRIAREGATIHAGDDKVGDVTSGTFSPTLERSIAMGYVAAQHSPVGTPLEIDVRGKRESTRVVALPFYKRSK